MGWASYHPLSLSFICVAGCVHNTHHGAVVNIQGQEHGDTPHVLAGSLVLGRPGVGSRKGRNFLVSGDQKKRKKEQASGL